MGESTARFDLIETMVFDPTAGLPMLELHMARMQKSADALGFMFDRHAMRNELQAATFCFIEAKRIRVLLSRTGQMAVEVRAASPWPQAIMQVAVVPRGLPANDARICHKTTDRRHYQAALQQGGTFEVLLTDEQGYLTEGCFSSIFVERGERLVTPPLSRGLLPGILRQNLIQLGEAEEADLKPHDLEDGFFIGNAARGLVAATVVPPKVARGG